MRTVRLTPVMAVVIATVLLLAAGTAATGPLAQSDEGSGEINLTATIASRISYQGRLTDAQGTPLGGSHRLVFQLWNHAAAGSQVGSNIVHNNVPVDNGLFTVTLDVPQEAFDGQALWMRVQVDGQWLSPRQELLPVPYALGLVPGAEVRGSGSSPALAASNESGGYGLSTYSASNIGLFAQSGVFIIDPPPSGQIAVYGTGSGEGVKGQGGHTGVHGVGTTDGVKGESIGGNAVHGLSTNGNGVMGESTAGTGVRGVSTNDYGVHGRTSAETKSGVYGASNTGKGVEGQSSSANQWVPAMYGKNEGAGDGVYGWSQNRHGTYGVSLSSNPEHAGLYGTNNGAGPGLYAQGGSNGVAAILKGNVQVKSRTTGETLIEIGEGLDYAEGFHVSDVANVSPGSVLVIDPDQPGKLKLSEVAYDRKVAGIVAGANGLGSAVRLGVGQFDYDVALAGRVYCNVDGAYGAVSPGDLLTTSPTPGHAMAVGDHSRAQGAILGKAMGSLAAGDVGQILVLVTLQ